jgi:hypothetical protein
MIDGLTNQCMIISIADYLHKIQHTSPLARWMGLNVRKLREIGGFTDSGHQMFSTSSGSSAGSMGSEDNDKCHAESLTRLLEYLDISVDVYYRNTDSLGTSKYSGEWISHPIGGKWRFNPRGSHRIAIVYSGAHFELIISRTETTESLVPHPWIVESRQIVEHKFSEKSQWEIDEMSDIQTLRTLFRECDQKTRRTTIVRLVDRMSCIDRMPIGPYDDVALHEKAQLTKLLRLYTSIH